jgi:very-short-patch-repair endonuclease
LEGVGGGNSTKLSKNMNNNFYNAVAKPLAHELRHNMTKSEACLWKYALKARKMKGYSFKRQRPILNFIVDFICIELKLIIEVDGYSHFLDEVVEKDHYKDIQLNTAGFHVLRFTDNQVLKDISNVIAEIEQYIEDIKEKDISSPPPAPSKGGHRTD